MTQKPIITDIEEQALRQAERHDQGYVPLHVRYNTVVTQRVLPHETEAQAKRRWAREAARQRELEQTQAPRIGGRVLPVRYD